MSQLPAIDSTDAALRASPNGFSSLSSADFIRIIFAELANQDPVQPNDSSALLDQMSSIRNIDERLYASRARSMVASLFAKDSDDKRGPIVCWNSPRRSSNVPLCR